MKRILTIILALCWMVQMGGAQADAPAVIRIFPQDVVQGSVQQLRYKLSPSTDGFFVRWDYSQSGANKMLAFWEANQGRTTYTQIGDFTSPLMLIRFRPVPPTITNFAQWKAAWLTVKTGKMACRTPEEVRTITAGLKSN